MSTTPAWLPKGYRTGCFMKWYMKCFIYWTADLKSSELWSSQLWTQFKQLRIEAWKSQDFNGVWTPSHMTSSNQLVTYDQLYPTNIWPAPNVSGFIAQLVRASHRYREIRLFQASIRNWFNCVYNCDGHRSLEGILSWWSPIQKSTPSNTALLRWMDGNRCFPLVIANVNRYLCRKRLTWICMPPSTNHAIFPANDNQSIHFFRKWSRALSYGMKINRTKLNTNEQN